MKRLISPFIIAGVAWSAVPPPKLARDLATTTNTGTIPVIVQWAHPANSTLDGKVAALGGSIANHLNSIKGGFYNVPGSALRTLASDPDVVFISPDRPIRSKLDNSAAAVNAAAAWSAGFTGAGVGVAVIDSGMNADPNLSKGKPFAFSYDFTQPPAAAQAAALLANISGPLAANAKGVPSTPAPDQFGHGQHVAGIIASNGQASQCATCKRSFKGMAYDANLIDLKVLDSNGQGSDSGVILAIDAAIALKNIYNIRVINLSVGRPVYESYTLDPLCQAVEAAWKAGIVVVAAAGNDGRDDTYGEQGYGTINAPGNDPYVITVGAMKTEGTYTRTDDLIASYSSKGPTAVDHIAKPDILAPGNQVVSLLAAGSTLVKENPANSVTMSYYQTTAAGPSRISNTYFILSGTSMATPVVSAAAADLIQANSALTPDQVKTILMQSAYKTFPASSSVRDPTTGKTFVDYYDLFTVGAGYLDLGAAMTLVNSQFPSGTAMSPVAQFDPNSGSVTLTFDASSVWSDRSMWGATSLWGTRSMWGASVLEANQVIWDSRSMWGAATTAGSASIWDSRSMWGAASNSSATTTTDQRSMWGADITVVGEN